MKIAAPLLLLGASDPAAVGAELDLYVREKFDGDCPSCAEGGGCHLKSRAFFVRGACFNRNDQKASVYDELADGVVCRQDFGVSCDVAESAFDAATPDDCRDAWTPGECAEREHMTKLAGWCTASDAPVGEFATPLLTFKEYDGLERCGTSDYSHLLLADEGGTCAPLSFPVDGAYVAGSRRVSCDGTAFVAERYESADCTGEAVRVSTGGSTDECPAEAAGEQVYTNNCGAPTIHCKNSPFFGGGGEEAEAAEEEEEEEGEEAVEEEAVEEEATNGAEVSMPQSQPPDAAVGRAAVGGLLAAGAALALQIA